MDGSARLDAVTEEGQASNCIFCRIAAREIPAEIVHASELVVAFRDANPQAPTHILLIPVEHLESAAAMDGGHGDLLANLFLTAAHLAKAEGIDASGWRMVTNIGPDAGQSVPHLHFHLLGGRRMGWPPG
jgi:histidine triad (HIT) family protein